MYEDLTRTELVELCETLTRSLTEARQPTQTRADLCARIATGLRKSVTKYNSIADPRMIMSDEEKVLLNVLTHVFTCLTAAGVKLHDQWGGSITLGTSDTLIKV